MAELVVLGAGPAGLMAALELARAGHDCEVLEAGDQVGGMAGSFEVGGQRVDFGSHRLHPASSPRVLELIADLLGPDLQTRPRAGRLRLADRWVGFPLRTTELIRTLPPLFTAKLALDSAGTIARKLLPGEEPETFEAATVARLGATVSDSFYGPYARKLYGLDPAELDVELARRRVAVSSPLDIARRLVQATTPAGRQFLYPRTGYGQIVERLAEAATDAGATIRLNTRADGVVVTPDGVDVRAASQTQRAQTVLSTIPATALAAILDPSPPLPVLGALGRRRTRAMLLVYLVLDRPQYTAFDAHYIPGPETVVARLSEPKNYRDGDDPGDRTVLCAEIACAQDDPLLGRSAADLAAMVADDLVRIGLPKAEPVEAETRILPSVYPVLDLAGRDDRAAIDRWLGSSDRVVSLGRQGLGVLDNLHHVLDMGSAAAAAIDADGRLDADRWRRSLLSFADNTVED